MTLADIIGQVTGAATTLVPDMALFIGAGVVVALGSNLVRRFIRAGR